MSNYIPSRKQITDFNGGKRLINGVDDCNADDINNVIESQLWVQKLAENSIDTSDANNVGTATVNITYMADGTPRIKISNIKGNKGDKGDAGEPKTVLQTTGQSTTAVMSQKAVTDALANKADKTQLQGLATEAYVDGEVTAQINGAIVQTTGSNVSAVMSQKAVTDALKKLIRSIDGSVYNTPKKIFDYIQSIYNYDEQESNIFSLNNGVHGGLIICAPTYEGLYYIGDGDGVFHVGTLNADDTTEISYAIEALQNVEGYATKKYVDSAIGNINSLLDAISGEVI